MNRISILIKNAACVIGDRMDRCDVGLDRTIELGSQSFSYEEQFDGEGLCVIPGLVDLHAHYREPGDTAREDLASGSQGAARGGYTYVNLMYDASPQWGVSDALDHVYSKARKTGLVEVGQSLFIGRKPAEDLDELLRELDPRVRILVVERSAYLNGEAMLKVLKFCSTNRICLMVQPEDRSLSGSHSELGEYVETLRCSELALASGCPIHFTHVTSSKALGVIQDYKRKGAGLTCDITPHHLLLEDMDYPVNPPIKSRAERKELEEGLLRGDIDAIATDHAPQLALDAKNGVTGVIGQETAFGLLYRHFVVSGKMTLPELVRVLSEQPARFLGLNKGRILNGWDADVMVFDPSVSWVVDPAELSSKSANFPFQGWTLQGATVMVIRQGEVIYFNQDYAARFKDKEKQCI